MHSSARQSITLIASWLILFQLFAPLTFTGDDLTLICGEQGVQEVRFDAQGNPIESNLLNEHCELCILSLAVLADELSVSAQNTPHFADSLKHKTLLLSHQSQGFASRAPPTFS